MFSGYGTEGPALHEYDDGGNDLMWTIWPLKRTFAAREWDSAQPAPGTIQQVMLT